MYKLLILIHTNKPQ